MRKTSSKAKLMAGGGYQLGRGGESSKNYGMAAGSGRLRDAPEKVEGHQMARVGYHGRSEDWVSAGGSGVLTTRAESLRGPTDPTIGTLAHE